MAQTVKIAGATYSDVPAVNMHTPLQNSVTFLDATTLNFELDSNDNIEPLSSSGFVYGQSNGGITPQQIKIANATYNDVPALQIPKGNSSYAWFIEASVLKFGIDGSGNIYPLASGESVTTEAFVLDNNGDLMPIS